MPLHGKGMLIVFCEVKARDERDFNEWYNREHIDERVNLPGFHRGRRYVAVRGSPKYLATYECDTSRISRRRVPGAAGQPDAVDPGSDGTLHQVHAPHRARAGRPGARFGGAIAAVRFTPDPRSAGHWSPG